MAPSLYNHSLPPLFHSKAGCASAQGHASTGDDSEKKGTPQSPSCRTLRDPSLPGWAHWMQAGGLRVEGPATIPVDILSMQSFIYESGAQFVHVS